MGLLKSARAAAQKQAARALGRLAAASAEAKRAIDDAKGIRPLVSLLESGTNETRHLAAWALGQLAGGSHFVEAIHKARGTKLLVELLENGDAKAKEAAAQALRSLAEGGAGLVGGVILRNRGIPSLLRLGSESALGALNLLSQEEKTIQDAIFSAGGLELSVHLLQEGSEKIKEHAAGILFGLSKSSWFQIQNRMLDAGGIEGLVAVLKSDSSTAQAMESAAGALSQFQWKRSHMALKEAGGAFALLCLLGEGTPLAKDYAASILEKIVTFDPSVSTAIVSAGGVALLATILASGDPAAERHAESVMRKLTIPAADVQPLKELLRSCSGKAPMAVAHGWNSAIPPLVNLLRSDIHMACRRGAEALCVLSEGGRLMIKEAICKAGAIPCLVKLLGTVGCAAEALGNLSQYVGMVVPKDGGLPALVALLKSDSAVPSAMSAAAEVLKLYAAGTEQRRSALLQAGGIPALVQFLAEDIPQADANALEALKLLAKGAGSEELKSAIHAAGGIKQLVLILQKGTSSNKAHSAEALKFLSEGNEGRARAILNAGGLKQLVLLLQKGTINNKAYAALALRSLAAGSEQFKRAIHEAGGVRQLVLLLEKGKDSDKAHAAEVLGVLSMGSDEMARAIRDAGGINMLVRLLKEGTDNYYKTSAAVALKLLANGTEEIKSAIRDAGGIPQLLAHGQEESVEAVKLLANGNEETKNAIRAAGGIPKLLACLEKWWLGPLCQSAAEALRSLANGSEQTKQAIRDAGGVGKLREYLVKRTVRGKEHAAKVLEHLGAEAEMRAADSAPQRKRKREENHNPIRPRPDPRAFGR